MLQGRQRRKISAGGTGESQKQGTGTLGIVLVPQYQVVPLSVIVNHEYEKGSMFFKKNKSLFYKGLAIDRLQAPQTPGGKMCDFLKSGGHQFLTSGEANCPVF